MSETGLNRALVKQPTTPPVRVEQTFFNLPTGQVPDAMLGLLSYGKNPELYAKRHEGLGKGNKKIQVETKEVALKNGQTHTSLTLTQETQAGTFTLYLPGVELLEGYNNSHQKFFNFVLTKLNEQCLHRGSLGRDYISFSLEELVELQWYDSTRAARRGFKDFRELLTSWKVKGNLKQGSKIAVDLLEVPFIGAFIANNQCIIKLNPDINWRIVIQYFTILPRYYYKLKSKAADLLYSVFYLARQKQNEDNIRSKGYFTISNRALQTRLALPKESETKSPAQKIREPIELALEEIEIENAKTDNELHLAFEPVEPSEGCTTKDWLDNGYLKVFLDGDYAQRFIEMSAKRAEQIAKAIKQKERRTEKAIAAKAAKAAEKSTASKRESPALAPAPAPAPEAAPQAEAPKRRRGRPPKKKTEDMQQLSLFGS